MPPSCFDVPATNEASFRWQHLAILFQQRGIKFASYPTPTAYLRAMEAARVQVGGPIPVLLHRMGEARSARAPVRLGVRFEIVHQRIQILSHDAQLHDDGLASAIVCLLMVVDRYATPQPLDVLDAVLEAFPIAQIETCYRIGGRRALVGLVSERVPEWLTKNLCSLSRYDITQAVVDGLITFRPDHDLDGKTHL